MVAEVDTILQNQSISLPMRKIIEETMSDTSSLQEIDQEYSKFLEDQKIKESQNRQKVTSNI